jgi:osmoprotectant transport system ATP-binding protein
MISIDHVSKSWDGGRTWSVRGVSLEVPEGTVLALLGGSGSGKSTTVKMVNRLVEPTSGKILIGGQNVLDRDPVELRRGIGYVFQGIGLFPHLTVADNVAAVPRLLNWEPARIQARVAELLDLVHLPVTEFGARLPEQLSGGQRQRVGFARALAAGPKVMILDEPFGALDPVTRDSLQTEFRGLQRRLNLTAVMVTHDMAEALILADFIAVMKDGQLLRHGTGPDLMRDPGDPYVEALLSTPRRHAKLIAAIEGAKPQSVGAAATSSHSLP